jgi:hypothetical protein
MHNLPSIVVGFSAQVHYAGFGPGIRISLGFKDCVDIVLILAHEGCDLERQGRRFDSCKLQDGYFFQGIVLQKRKCQAERPGGFFSESCAVLTLARLRYASSILMPAVLSE